MVSIVCPMLFPEQHQRHALAVQFLMQAAIVRLHMVAWPLWRDQQAPLKSDLA
jgi:hypothetical protein